MTSKSQSMPRVIDGVRYHSVSEIEDELHVSRQTLWRWRREGSIPVGQRFRNRQVLFTDAEVQAIRGFANRLTPIVREGGETHFPLFPNG
jgi:protein involved in temperature-dependent protein secretion